MKYYKLDIANLEKELDTNIENGLSDEQVAKRFKECGYNTSYSKATFSFKFFNVFFLCLYFAIPAIHIIFALFDVNNFLKHITDAVVFILIFLSCYVIFAVLKYSIDRGMYLSSLKKSSTLTVVRNGVNVQVKYTEIMYGDIVLLHKGDYIPFDGVIVSSNGLVTDESSISGDNRSSKHTGVISVDNISPSQLFNSVFCGTYVVHGKAKVVVTDIASRVYIVKSGKLNENKTFAFSKVVDVSTAFLLALSVVAIVMSIVCGMISGEYLQILTLILLFSSVIVSGIIKLFAELVYKKAFLNLYEKKVFLSSYSDVEILNNSDILVVDSNLFFENDSEISSFISENNELTSVTAITKSNFSPFLYTAFCLERDSSIQKACYKILKKIGIDFSEVDTMCPVFSRSKSIFNSIEICSRAYDGNNILIAVGSVNDIIKISDCNSDIDLSKLNSVSTEMVAVAIKNVEIVPEDLFSESTGYKFIGVLGVNRKISGDVSKCFLSLKKNNTHPIVVFPGNKKAIMSVVNDSVKIVSFNDIITKNEDKINYNEIDIICDFDGNYNDLIISLSRNGHLPSYFGEKVLRDKKTLAFKSNEISSYDSKDADIIAPEKLSSVCSALIESKKSVNLINKLLKNIGLFLVFFAVVGLFTAIFHGELLMSTMMSAIVILIVLPIDFTVCLFKSKCVNSFSNDAEKPLSFKDQRRFLIVSALIFIVVSILAKILIGNISFVVLFFIAFLCAEINTHAPFSSMISLLMPVIIACVFVSPLSSFLGISSIGVIMAVLSILIGVLSKFVVNYICRSVKF